MWILTVILFFFSLIGAYIGSRNSFHIDNLSSSKVLNAALVILIVFTLLMLADTAGIFPQNVSAPFMMSLYSFVAGFFLGYAFRLMDLRAKSGGILYQHRTFWVDHAPNLLAIALIIYGIYRTALLTELPITGIRVTSGLSLMCFGFFGWTLKPVPEFRDKGVLFLDRKISWERVISWNWASEDTLTIEYLKEIKNQDGRIVLFDTLIPQDERNKIEAVLKIKMDEYADKRNELLFPDEKNEH